MNNYSTFEPLRVLVMKSVRLIAAILYHLTRWTSMLVFFIVAYTLCGIIVHVLFPEAANPMRVLNDERFEVFLPFTKIVFLLGDYTASFLVSNLLTIAFYGLFLWLLSDIFQEFRRLKLFTRKGVYKLSFFYMLNLLVPFLFIALLFVFGDEVSDIVRIILLHLVIGIFAFFMAAIFKQGVVLQEERDLTI